MKPFPLFKLPYLALKHVIVRLDFIKLALCSVKCYRIIKSMKLSIRTMTVIQNLYNRGVQLEFKRYFIYHWFFEALSLKMNSEEYGEHNRYNKNYFPAKCGSNPDENYVCAVECLVDFVRDLFKIDYIIYEIHESGFTNFREYFLEQIVNRKNVCDEVSYGGYANEFRRFPMENSDLSFVLDNTPVGMELHLSGIMKNDFSYEKPLIQKNVMISAGKWLTLEHLYNSSYQRLLLDDHCKFTLQDYNLLVKKWVNYELQKDFESVRIPIDFLVYDMNWFEDEKNLSILFDGLELKEFDFSRNLRNYRRVPVGFYNPYKLKDIHRDDGMIASISIHSENFAFRVWIPAKCRYYH
ncbi:unnamed protein product [Caenorhabditis brenneri]